MLFGLPTTYLVALFSTLVALLALAFLLLHLRRRWRSAASRKVRLANAALGLACFFFLLTLTEGLFAFFYDATDGLTLLNTTQRWFHRYNQLNRAGWRGRRLAQLKLPGWRDRRTLRPDKPPGTTRICFVGDSFTWGHGIKRLDDRFTDRVADSLSARSPGRCEVYNLSFFGWETSQELALLHDLIDDRVQLDILVLIYCLNDIRDLLPEAEQTTNRIYDQDPRFFLFRDTYFFNFLYHRLRVMTTATYRDYYGEVRRAYASPLWDQQRARLAELARLCRSAKIDLRVVTFPFLQELGPGYSYQGAHRRLADLWSELRVPHLDLLDTFASHAPAQLMINRFDPHPNHLAHRLAADAIFPWLLAPPLAHRNSSSSTFNLQPSTFNVSVPHPSSFIPQP